MPDPKKSLTSHATRSEDSRNARTRLIRVREQEGVRLHIGVCADDLTAHLAHSAHSMMCAKVQEQYQRLRRSFCLHCTSSALHAHLHAQHTPYKGVRVCMCAVCGSVQHVRA